MKKFLIIAICDYDDEHRHMVFRFTNLKKFKHWVNLHEGISAYVDLHIFICSCEFQHVFNGLDYDFIDQVDEFLDFALKDVLRETV